MPRRLSMPFLTSALDRGKEVEQLLSVSEARGTKCVRWIALWHKAGHYTVSLHNVRKVDGVPDVTEWPAVDEAEPHGEGIWTTFASIDEALAYVENELAGSRLHFVNQGMIGDEIEDVLGRSS
jgi:hypothetical protein